MLEKIDLNKKMSKQEYSESLPKIEAELGRLQRECKDLDIPVMIVFEGFGASGKGLQIGKLIHSMDPRGFEVHTIKNETEEERMHPFLWRFWIKTPEKGKIAVFEQVLKRQEEEKFHIKEKECLKEFDKYGKKRETLKSKLRNMYRYHGLNREDAIFFHMSDLGELLRIMTCALIVLTTESKRR